MKAFPSTKFARSSFACKCGCGGDTVDCELLFILELIESHFHSFIDIHCGFRCLEHNRNEGSKDTSQHPKGKAVDFHITGIPHQKVYDFLKSIFHDCYGLSLYSWGIHLDVREKKARW